jgi:hypothetical protein
MLSSGLGTSLLYKILWPKTKEFHATGRSNHCLTVVRIPLLFGLTVVTFSLLVSCSQGPTATNSQASVNAVAPIDYAKRIGVAVRTSSRTCVAIKDGTLQSGSAVTLVLPLSPQRFISAQISSPSSNACPITEEVAPDVSNYELSVPPGEDLPKLTPLVAVLGAPASTGFAMDNLNVQGDIDRTHNKNTFRACGANDGVHLTVWKGIPITGTLLWTGHYYETGAAGNLPSCTPGEMALK